MISLENIKNYPSIKNLRKNSYYSGILQNLYAGSESETIMFLQFRYQAYILHAFQDELSQLLKNIANNELLHQELLANAIIMSGGDPIFSNAQNKWLGGRQIDYIKDIKQILSYDIELKEKSIIDYKIAIAKIENSEIKSLLNSILQDEELHLKQLKSALENI